VGFGPWSFSAAAWSISVEQFSDRDQEYGTDICTVHLPNKDRDVCTQLLRTSAAVMIYFYFNTARHINVIPELISE